MNRRTLALAGLLIGFTVTVAAAQWHPLSELRITQDLDMDGFDLLNIGTIGAVDSTSQVQNLNSDQIDGHDGSYYLDDTNAQTICSGSKALTGDGSCMNVGGADTSASTECSGSQVLLGNGDCTSIGGYPQYEVQATCDTASDDNWQSNDGSTNMISPPTPPSCSSGFSSIRVWNSNSKDKNPWPQYLQYSDFNLRSAGENSGNSGCRSEDVIYHSSVVAEGEACANAYGEMEVECSVRICYSN